jgi:O-succinylbenzoic acid--CoA ligase
MTETLSHIALRKVNSQDATDWYTPMPGVSVHLSGKGTLVIDAPSVCEKVLTTNDIAEISPDRRFRIRGRLDNVIDTGGIKVQAEEVEQKLAERIPGAFCITSVPDDRLGEKITLLHTSGMTDTELDALCRDVLPKYWVPRAFIRVEAIPLTGTGKTARADAKKLALSKYFPAG